MSTKQMLCGWVGHRWEELADPDGVPRFKCKRCKEVSTVEEAKGEYRARRQGWGGHDMSTGFGGDA